ncbi:MAG TPA: dienelactone hydrolase family protein [Candidatus Dormibacteraeota bacterium]|nr:dienelactone hydrolase family protein [Candidatus Dormibacteraeota bacterium]
MTGRPGREGAVSVPAGKVVLAGDLTVPSGAQAVVLFAHGSGSSRFSPRHRYVARQLQAVGLATLLMDLLTAEEERASRAQPGGLRFDVVLLAERLVAAIDWLRSIPPTRSLRLGCFGASTGAAAALDAAARRPREVGAIVSRGGRPDLARELEAVRAPTLLIVGGADTAVLRLNREAMRRLRSERRLEVVAGATHLFEEPGALERVAELAVDWFRRHLAAGS